jgi:type III secretion translocon protein HrpF
MDLHVINRMLPAVQPLPSAGPPAATGGLPPALQQGLDAAVRSSMHRLPADAAPLIDLPMPRTVVEVPMPAFGPVRPPLVTDRPAPRPQEAAWQLPVAQPPVAQAPAPYQPLVSLPMPVLSPPPTPAQLMADKGRAMVEEFEKNPPPAGKGLFGALRRHKAREALNDRPEVIEYRRQQAESFKHNYIPSDGGNTPREITRNDALKELYAYSDYLPKKTSLKTLQDIVDGTFDGRRPPQLVAAARYMLDHPDEWKQVTGKEGDDRIKRAALNDALSRNIQLGAGQLRTLETLERNANDFFDGRLFGREKLQKIIDDPGSKRENVEAARHLLADPVLFGMLDNTEYGHKSTGWRKSDDGLIGRNDLREFMEKVNRTPAPAIVEQPRLFVTAADLEAAQAMLKGQEGLPLEKTVKGGQAKKIVSGVMKGFSVFYKVGSAALGAVAALKIPLVSQVAALGSMAANAYSGLLDIGRTAINGGNVKAEAAKAGLSFASNAISVATAPGTGKVVTSVGTEVAKAAAKGAAKEAAKEAGKEAAEHVVS